MAFTDMREYEKWKEKNPDFPTFALKLEDYGAMLVRKDAQGNACPALGIVINPFGANIVIPSQMLIQMLSARVAQAKQAAERQAVRVGAGIRPGGAPDKEQ